MNATFKSLLALALVAVAMVFASCSKDDETVGPTQEQIETKLVGKWKIASRDGEPYPTDLRMVHTFMPDGQCLSSFSRSFKLYPGMFWANKKPFTYTVKSDTVAIHFSGNDLTFAVSVINDQMFAFDESRTFINGDEMSRNDKHCEYVKVTKDFSKDILGVWEGVEMTGDETYGNAQARIAYYADGTYTYYRRVADVWYPSSDEACEYNVDGDWLATRWKPAMAEDYNYEWWDIDEIKDGTMKWSALREREDGSRYTTTFTWKKVNDTLPQRR